MGGAAIALTNKPSLRARAKYELEYQQRNKLVNDRLPKQQQGAASTVCRVPEYQ
ncbi:hypothetical protein HaLaN_06690 [Haematococcus lacustris]|uniref:Uncharacterized protein n=1 Tax=Haematococcus lacustris TaxID=44745 RepID=A0A699Z6W0_HAELA|nr:hypothetical protein HaLaN_06690 [Haematococcus lacustris]